MRRLSFCLSFVLLIAATGCQDKGESVVRSYAFPDSGVAPDSILEAAKALRAKAESGSAADKAVAEIYMGLYFGRTGAYRQSRKAFSSALSHAEGLNDSQLNHSIYAGLGNAAKNLAEFPEALNMFSRALRYGSSDSLFLAGVHANIAQVFQLQEDLESATTHLNQARALSGTHTDFPAYLKILHTLANVHGMSNRIDSALLLDAEGIAISRRINVPALESTFLDNKANCFLYSGRPEGARVYFMQSLRIDSAIGDLKQMADTWLNLGQLEELQGRSQKAEANYLQGIRLADSCGYRMGVMSGWNALSGLYSSVGDYRNALAAKNRHYAVRDSVTNVKKEAAIAEWKAVYETEKKEKELRVQSLQLREKTQLIWFVSVSSALLLIAIYFANRRNKVRKEQRYREALVAREQEAAQKIVIAEDNERRRIAADLHDGIGQTLTAAWLNLQAIQPKLGRLDSGDAKLLGTTMQLVGESCAEIRQISHNMMPAMLLNRGLVPAIRELGDRIRESGLDVRMSVDEGEIVLSKPSELLLYRIVQECVTNVVRHSGATALYMSIAADAAELGLMIEDNGTGFDTALREGAGGLGMQNIRSRVHYLHGTVEWSSSYGDGGGTVVAIHIPMNHDSTN